MSQSDPSEFELHRKARSLGLLLRTDGSIVSGLNFQVSALASKGPGHSAENRDIKSTRQSLPGIGGAVGGDGTGTQRSQHTAKAVALPKIPSIKHPLEKRPLTTIQRDGTSTGDTPLSLTTLLMTPRSKTTLHPSSSFTGKKLKPSGNRWSTNSETFRKTRSHPTNTNLVISPKSRADLHRSPGDFYQHNFPHVHLDRSLPHTGQEVPGSQEAIPGTVGATSRHLLDLTRARTDAMAVERLIQRTEELGKATRTWAVAGWLDGMTCNPKKLHNRRGLEYLVN